MIDLFIACPWLLDAMAPHLPGEILGYLAAAIAERTGA